jgi:biopolymer transport protein ExbD
MIFKRRCEIARGQLDIAPLIDCVLLLLLFFMLSSSMILPTVLRVSLPQSSAAAIEQGRAIRVTIDKSGALYWQGEGVTQEALGENIARLAAVAPDTLLVLDADREVSHGRVVTVMSLARAHGLTRLAIAATRERAGKE